MIIFLDASLVLGLQEGRPGRSRILGALTVCAQQAREGTHIIVAERGTFNGIEASFPELDARTVATLRRSSEKLTLRKQIREFVVRAIRVVSDEIAAAPYRLTVGTREEIVLPAGAVDANSSLVGNPLLMVENLNDGHAYLKLARSVADDIIFPGHGWLKNVPLRCEIAPGGGNTLANLFSYHKGMASRTGLAVADGDYRFAGSAMGDTARALHQVASAAPPSPLLDALVLSVRSIENCLPRAEVSRIATELDPVQFRRYSQVQDVFATSPFWSVVPIKSGVRCFELSQASLESTFWTALFGPRRCDPVVACKKKQDCANFVLPPVSDKVLARAASADRDFAVTPQCAGGLSAVWRQLLVFFFSLFCGGERLVAI